MLLVLWFIPAVKAYNEFFPYAHNPKLFPPQESVHFYEYFTTPLPGHLEGSNFNMPEEYYTPDFRVEETPFFAFPGASWIGIESNRPFRLSPHWKQRKQWKKPYQMDNLGCGCTTVYRRTTLLAGCALITYKHLITTATSTQLILQRHKNLTRLEEILGAYYDSNENIYNSSNYFPVSRIHNHPKFFSADDVNASHPIPCMYDLSVWECMFGLNRHAIVCARAASGYWWYASTYARPTDMGFIVGYQFIKAFRRKPMPWYKYGVRSRDHVLPCPKTEWGWFNCLMGDWAKLGVESGASYHMRFEDYRQDGLAGIAAFSLRLRAKQIVHYFTPLDTYPVLDFLYDSYLGRIPSTFIDDRFYDNKWYSTTVKGWFYYDIKYIKSNCYPRQGYYYYKYPPFY